MRGPLDVLREMWTEEETEKTTEVTHLVQMRERLAEMTGVVKANLLKAQQKQKKAYDKKVTPQTFKEGDKVLVLLPARQNKLQLQWEGPYTITKVTPVDWEVRRPGRRQERKFYHVNLLKKWHANDISASLLALSGESMDEMEEGDLDFLEISNASQTPNISTSRLTPEQTAEISKLLQEFPRVTGDELGHTTVTEHTVTTGDAAPIRQPPYRVPIALKDTMKKELDRMLQLGVAEPSSSPWASPVVLAEKKDGGVRFCVDALGHHLRSLQRRRTGVRFCVDYRKVNQVAKFDAYPMPRIEEVLEQVGPATCISTLDLA